MNLCKTLWVLIFLQFPWGAEVNGQYKLSWDDFYDVTFTTGEDSLILIPDFGPEISQYDGEIVYLSGYVIPLNFQANAYVLSAYPNASCFFCGGAGPESVLELQLKIATRNYRTDEWKRFKGKLCLNRSDPNHLHYILENAEEY